MNTKKLLIIEDSIETCSILGIMLRKMGFLYLTVAHSANEGVGILEDLYSKGINIDLVLMNINLPGINGADLCRQIKFNPSYASLPIIMLTGEVEHEGIEEAVLSGADDFVEKPLRYTDLFIRIKIALRINISSESNQFEPKELVLAPRQNSIDVVVSKLQNLVYRVKKDSLTDQLTLTVTGGKLAERMKITNDLLLSEELRTYFKGEDLLIFREHHNRAFQGSHTSFEIQHTGHWYLFTLSPVLVKDQLIEVLGSAIDITPQKKREQLMRISEERLRTLFDYTPVMICAMDKAGFISDINTYFLDKIQYTHPEIVGKNIADLLTSSSKVTFVQTVLPKLLKEIKTRESEVSIVTRSGEILECLLNSKIIVSEEGESLRIFTTLRDQTERIRNEQEMHYLAYHDHLTRLPNRALFYKNFHHSLNIAKVDKTKLAVMLIDVDHFKSINDSMGHRKGDEVLCAISTILSGQVASNDTVARLGGDEFVILIHNYLEYEDINYKAERILLALRNSVEFISMNLTATVSIGISMYPRDGDDVDTLIMKADRAMYYSKQNGRNRFHWHKVENDKEKYNLNRKLTYKTNQLWSEKVNV
ncbi:diguanylate cyclase domain-containing protein [Paenibacillus sp. sgz500958]|uniref:two-component system response regulator n=1 Tax=Paenibacillus sp. sgz500958 TaxID=3242475 RepID=UPI0036D38B71